MLKKKLIIIIVFFVFLFSINYVYCLNTNDNLIGKSIYIDPGHGGADPGAIYKNIKESTINLDVSRKLKTQLEELGAIVYITRDEDYDLSSTTTNRKKSDLYNRIYLINESDVGVYISIHINAETSSLWYGAQTFYYPANKNNVILAEYIQKSLVDNTGTKRKISKIEDVLMYKNIKVPGVLIELGFITNYSDRIKLINEQYQNDLVDSISTGLVEYFKS